MLGGWETASKSSLLNVIATSAAEFPTGVRPGTRQTQNTSQEAAVAMQDTTATPVTRSLMTPRKYIRDQKN